MSTTVGRLTIDMVANVARLQRDMEQAKKSVGTAMGSIQKTVDLAKKALIGLGGVLAVGKFASFIKGAIDSADQMSKLSQRIGVSVKDVAGLELAFRQSGLQAGALQQSMGRLSVAIANGNRALEVMGVQTRNVDGTLKDTRQVLGEVANRFASYQDGAAKSALAIELFGRAGADMIPLLNGGAEGLEKFDEMAKKLGLTLDEETTTAAEKFNDTLDLVRASAEGMARQVAAQLLPTLESMAEAFFNLASESDILQNVAKAITVVFQTLTVVGSDVAFVLVQIGKAFVALKNATGEALRGNFKAAREVFAEYNRQANESRQALDRFQATVMGTGSATVSAFTDMTKAVRDSAPSIKQLEERVKRQAEAQRIMNRELDDYFKAEEQARLAKERAIGTAREMVEQIEFETAALRMTNTEREIAIRLRELERRGIRQGSREYEEFSKRIREAVVGRQAVEASIEQQRRAKESWDKTWEQVAQSFTDALMQGGKSVKEYLISLFRTMVLRPLLQPIIVGGAGMMGGIANAMGFGPDSGGVGSTFNLVNTVRSAYQAISGGFTALGNSVAFAADSMGAWLVNNTSGILNQMGGSLMQSASTLGTAASYLGGAAAGLALGTVISNGYSAIGKSGNISVVAGTAIGAMFGGPIGAAIGGAIGGAVNRAFGRRAPQTTGQGITGTFSTTGASMQAFEEWHQKGGWFRSSKSGVNYSAIGTELKQFLDASLIQITQATRMYAHILGLNADAVNGVTQSVRISLRGLSAEQQQEAIMRALGGFGDRLAQQFDLSTVQRQGETAGEALSRLANSLVTVNQVLGTLNQTLLSTSLASGSAASALLDIFGGTEEFAKATTAYYQAFYTEAERTAKATQQLTEVLASMGFALPTTRAAFRALVEAQDLMTHAGRQNYAALVRLSAVFDEITPKLDTLAGQLGSLVAGLVSETIDDVTKQITLSRRAADEARQAANAFASAGHALRQTATALLLVNQRDGGIPQQYRAALAAALGGNVQAMQALPELARSMQDITRTRAATGVEAAIAAAQIAAELSQVAAVADVMEQGADYQVKLYDVNTAMLEVLRTTLQSGNATVETLREQLNALEFLGVLISESNYGIDSLENRAKEQIDITDLVAMATGANAQLSNAILNQLQIPDAGSEFLSKTIALGNDFIAGRLDGVIAAINGQTMAQQAEIKRQQDLQKAQAQLETLAKARDTAYQQTMSWAPSMPFASKEYFRIQNTPNDPLFRQLFQEYEQRFIQTHGFSWNANWGGGDAARIQQLAMIREDWKRITWERQRAAFEDPLEAQREAIRALGGVPAFAAGGMHMGGLRMVGENGPELEVTGPARYFSASQTAAMMGGGAEVATELRHLREENKAQARALVGLQSRMTRLLERWDNDGIPEERNVSA